jgi:hypothetical protein
MLLNLASLLEAKAQVEPVGSGERGTGEYLHLGFAVGGRLRNGCFEQPFSNTAALRLGMHSYTEDFCGGQLVVVLLRRVAQRIENLFKHPRIQASGKRGEGKSNEALSQNARVQTANVLGVRAKTNEVGFLLSDPDVRRRFILDASVQARQEAKPELIQKSFGDRVGVQLRNGGRFVGLHVSHVDHRCIRFDIIVRAAMDSPVALDGPSCYVVRTTGSFAS